MQVKGTLLMDYVRMLRSAKGKNWSQWLTPADLEIIQSKILPSQWYPYETMQRIGLAIFKELANSDLNLVRAFGKFMARNLAKVYQQVIIAGDPISSVEKIVAIQRTLFKDTGSGGRIIERSEKRFTFEITAEAGINQPEAAAAAGHQTAGVLEGIIELAGGKNVKTEIREKGEGFDLRFSWE